MVTDTFSSLLWLSLIGEFQNAPITNNHGTTYDTQDSEHYHLTKVSSITTVKMLWSTKLSFQPMRSIILHYTLKIMELKMPLTWPRFLHFPYNVGHASLKTHKCCQMRRKSWVILGERFYSSIVVLAPLTGQETQGAMPWCSELSMRLKITTKNVTTFNILIKTRWRKYIKFIKIVTAMENRILPHEVIT